MGGRGDNSLSIYMSFNYIAGLDLTLDLGQTTWSPRACVPWYNGDPGVHVITE